jgi:nucleoside-diphosphate-sugar epimerase
VKRVLVTGATGFVGRQSLKPLIERGFEVTAVTSRAPIESALSVKWVRADLMDPVQVAEVMAEVGPTHLLHFAWYAEPGKFWTATENFQWVRASLSLMEEFARCGGTRMVSAGTCAEYDWNHGCCVENLTPLVPNTVYGVCKCAFQAMQTAFCRQAGISSAWGRIFFLYGPHEHPKRLVSSVILALLRDEPARCSHGRQIRDFLHVEDVANAFASLLASEAEGAVNIGSGQPVTLKEVVQTIARRLDREDQVQLGAIAAANDPPLLLADTRRLTEEVAWSPHYSLESGLEQTIAWQQQQGLGF